MLNCQCSVLSVGHWCFVCPHVTLANTDIRQPSIVMLNGAVIFQLCCGLASGAYSRCDQCLSGCHQAFFILLLLLQFLSDSHETRHACSTCQCAQNCGTGFWNFYIKIFREFLSASLYVSKRGAYWDRLCRDVVGWLVVGWSLVGWLSRACTVAKRCILGI